MLAGRLEATEGIDEGVRTPWGWGCWNELSWIVFYLVRGSSWPVVTASGGRCIGKAEETGRRSPKKAVQEAVLM